MNSHPCIRCNIDDQRWYLPITDESVCHSCYQALLGVLVPAERKEIRREARDFIERDAWRDLWRRGIRPERSA
jgi:hypothetical protein